jgi:hypothetical protein
LHNAFLKINTEGLFEGISKLQIDNDLQLDQIKEHNIDVIINFTEIEPNRVIQSGSKYGLWFLSHCDLNKIGKKPYGIWEMLKKLPETVGTLSYVKDDITTPIAIDQTSSCTDGLSYSRNLNDIFWQTQGLIFNNIKLLAKDETLFFKKVESKKGISSMLNSNISFVPPSSIRILGFGLMLYIKKFAQLINSTFFFDQWALIFFNNNNNSNAYLLKNYKKILPPKDRFWADPFLIENNNKYYLFIEELIYKNKLGHLSVMEIDEHGNYSKPEKILVKDYHLSYPFIFKDNGMFFMIPETSGNNDIQIYRATEFPLKWELERVIMKNVVAVDTTIYKKDDTYWMFTNIRKHNGQSKHVELNLFSSKELVSDNWIPHPLNPVKTDIKSARPAGALFKDNNKLLRPSQNCSNYYGYGLNISEVTKLDESNFEEILISGIEPKWEKGISCTHSFNSVGQLFISDIKIKRSKFF